MRPDALGRSASRFGSRRLVYRAAPAQGFSPSSRGSGKARLMIAAAVALFALISYFASSEYNPVTGEKQHLGITRDQEIALGMQAVPEMIQEYGGLYPDRQVQDYLDQVGLKVVHDSAAGGTDWQFDFHLLNDPQTVNAFALPGGQVFITTALYERLGTEGRLAGVLGHEIGHVVARHSAQRIAKSRLTEGLTGAVLVASGDSGYDNARIAAMIGEMVNMKFGREDELESDRLGVRFMSEAGYDPRALIEVMHILDEASQGARTPEFFSTHPNPENRIAEIESAIGEVFPDGVPGGLVN